MVRNEPPIILTCDIIKHINIDGGVVTSLSGFFVLEGLPSIYLKQVELAPRSACVGHMHMRVCLHTIWGSMVGAVALLWGF